MATVYNWTCKYCNRPQVGADENRFFVNSPIRVGDNEYGDTVGYRLFAIACQNQECKKVSLNLTLTSNGSWANSKWIATEKLKEWALLPESIAKPQPEYIPKPLRDDYFEACRIRDLSPKASATLARRCLQGMIRDFAGISRPTLDAEIKELQSLVDADKAPRGVTPESVEAIDHVRKIGNIGAHMESDINLIIDIEPDEAQILLELVETLFVEWYVSKHEREKRFETIANLRAKKDAAKKAPKD